ncbi:MAG: glutamate-5-semialdehyde dehydrogenase [Planctomycetota bacterium]
MTLAPADSAAASVANVPAYCEDLTARAQAAKQALASVPGAQRDRALRSIAQGIRDAESSLRKANALDLDAGRSAGLSSAMFDRLELTPKRIESIALALEQIAGQPDPLGRVMDGRVLPNGIRLEKRRVAIGVVLIIFESRPNVTADAAALCLKAGNAAILRGGKEAAHSNRALADCVRAGLVDAGLPGDAVQLVGTTDRSAVGELLNKTGRIDMAIPRGGKSLISAVVEQARIPVVKHYDGNCHVYVDASADHDMAHAICLNAKTQRTGVCNAAETILFHADTAQRGLAKRVLDALIDAGVEVRGDARVCAEASRAKPAAEADWTTEYLDMIVAARVVDDLHQAVEHINHYGSKHTDAIVTSRLDAADAFVQAVDTANAMVNCSTRFSDGQEYGLGAEIGISTDKLHARGPMGAEDLTTYQWVLHGNGQVRG